jgi:hypothetical protein
MAGLVKMVTCALSLRARFHVKIFQRIPFSDLAVRCGRGETGRRERLKISCLMAYRFDPGRPHQTEFLNSSIEIEIGEC